MLLLLLLMLTLQLKLLLLKLLLLVLYSSASTRRLEHDLETARDWRHLHRLVYCESRKKRTVNLSGNRLKKI